MMINGINIRAIHFNYRFLPKRISIWLWPFRIELKDKNNVDKSNMKFFDNNVKELK